MSDEDGGGYDSCGDEGDYGSYEGDDGSCYDDSGDYGSYEDEAAHYDDREIDEDYEACDEECDDAYASSQETEDGDASRYIGPTYSSCEEFDIVDSDIDRVDDDVEHMGYSYASSLSVANGVQGSSRGPSISMGGGGGCSVGKKKLASSRYAKRPNASNSHEEVGLRDGVAFATKGLYAVRGVDDCSRGSAMSYGTKARGTYGFHGKAPSSTSNNISNVGRVTGSGGCSSGVATSGGIRKTQVVGVDTCGRSSSHLDANLQNLGRCRFVVEVDGIGGYLLKIGGTDANCISTSLVDRLRIPCHKLEHPYEYDGVWVSKEARVLVSHRNYKCYMWYDVYPMRHIDVWIGDRWLEGKRVQYSVVKDAYLVGVGQRVYDFVPYRAKSRVPTSAPSLAMQMSKEQDLHSMGIVEQSRSPTITRSGGTSATKELMNVNKVSQPQVAKPSGSPTKKKEASSDESPSPRFRVDVKSPPTPAMGILGPRPNSPEFERQKIERSKGATGDNSRVEKGEVVLSDVSGLSPPESTPDLGKKMREKKEGKRKIESEGTPYSNLNPLSFSSMCLNSCVGILGGKPMEPQPCSEMERRGEGDAECELQGEDVLDTSKVLLNGWLRIYRRQRREQELMQHEVIEEIIYGLESGILFGISSVISKMGFLFLEQGFSKLLVPICISISICCSASGFVCQTRGLKHGRAIILSTCAAVASIVTGVLAGMLALGEQLPSAPTSRLWLLLGWLCIILGVILLVASTRLVRSLPRSWQRFLRRGVDRNLGLRHPGPNRSRDTSPSAVIQASTLHHLISTSSKAKT